MLSLLLLTMKSQLLATLSGPFFLRIILESLWTSLLLQMLVPIKQLKRREKLEQLLGSVMTLLVKVRAGLWITALTASLMSTATNTRHSLLWMPITWFLQAT